ncbi:hypothetical protein ERJ75_000463600 [Trypanosoma vivax]|uniref:Flagellar attachment zone protein 1 conserved domain-containing protein n=1 Tax=Trypanosoma vivax (strain Y486) TaxID=1055687 RepID=G0U581_TRYVY|nr:hypothetical protein TRVL_04101 [Trypanosoma vivax]KAH8616662.1 hypothetical protein ERJ75_000463600 [Trypanosoma vivax]CCC51029.1 conserved hypothetical protein [Trypanosoma vivax Y486]
MEERRKAPRKAAAPRSVSTNAKPGFMRTPSLYSTNKTSSSRSVRSASASAASKRPPVPPSGDAGKNEADALRLLLREREHQVNLLAELIAEKQLLISHEKTLEGRIGHYEEQLRALASLLESSVEGIKVEADKNGKAKLTSSGVKTKKEESAMDPISVGLFSVRNIMDDVHKLRYENIRLASELAKRDQELEKNRAELQQVLSDGAGCELKLESPCGQKESPMFDVLDGTTLFSKEMVSDMEWQLKEMREQQERTNNRLIVLQTEYSQVRETLREREEELLTTQRRERDAADASMESRKYEMCFAQWKDPSKLEVTRHYHRLVGDEWMELVEQRPEAVRSAFLRDASLELRAPYGFITVISMLPGPGIVTVEFDVRHPVVMSVEDVELQLMGCAYDELTKVLQQRDVPPEGQYNATQRLGDSGGDVSQSSEKIAYLEEQLRLAQKALKEQQRDHTDENEWVKKALDETEETVKATYAELQKQWGTEKDLRSQLQQSEELIKAHEQRIAGLMEKLLSLQGEAERGLGLTPRGSKMVEQEEGEGEDTCEAAGNSQAVVKQVGPTFTVSVGVKWGGKNQTRATTRMSLISELKTPDSRMQEVLCALVLAEAVLLTKAVPIKVSSLNFTEEGMTASVELQFHSGIDRAVLAEQPFSSKLCGYFLDDLQNMREDVQSLVEELACVNDTLAMADGGWRDDKRNEGKCEAISPTERVAHLIVKLAETQKVCIEQRRQRRLERTQFRMMEEERRSKELALQRATESLNEKSMALDTLRVEHELLQKKYASIKEVRSQQVLLLESMRLHRERERKSTETVPGSEVPEAPQEVMDYDILAALSKAYKEYDVLYERYKGTRQELLRLEKALSEKLSYSARQSEDESRMAVLIQKTETFAEERQVWAEKEKVLQSKLDSFAEELRHLQGEMARRGEWAEELMRRLVEEEDARGKLERLVKKLKTSAPSSRVASSNNPLIVTTNEEVQRLRSFCVDVLKLHLTEKEQSVGEIVTAMERQSASERNSSVSCVSSFDSEEVAHVIPPMNAAIRLLQRVLSVVGGNSIEPVVRNCEHRLHEDSANLTGHAAVESEMEKGGDACKADQSITSIDSGMQTQALARPPEISGRRFLSLGTPSRHAGFSPLGRRLEEQRKAQAGKPGTPHHPQLMACALAIVRLAEQLSSAAAHHKAKLSKEQSASDLSLVVEECSDDFVHRSRSQAISLVLVMRDNLHEALNALHAAVHSAVANPGAQTLRTVEDSIMYALRRFGQTAGEIFMPRELRDIEAKHGAAYFAPPIITKTNAAPCHTPKQEAPCSPFTTGLSQRNANMSVTSGEKVRSASREPDTYGTVCKQLFS